MLRRPLFPAALLLLLPPLLLACGEKEEPKGDEGGGEGSGDEGAGDEGAGDEGAGDEGGDEGTAPGYQVRAESVISLSPATLPADVGGTVVFTVRAAASLDDGSEAPLEEAVAALSFEAVLGDGSVVPADVRIDEEGDLLVSVALPPGLAPPEGVRSPIRLTADGELLADVAVGLYTNPDALLSTFTGDTTGHIDTSALSGETLCHTTTADADGDGLIEVLSLHIGGGNFTVRDCTAINFTESGWTCRDSSLDAGLKPGEDLLCGTTHHFRTATGEIGISGVFPTTDGRFVQLNNLTWDGLTVTGTGTSAVAAFAIFGVVLGLNNTKKEPGSADIALLIDESSGRWGGTYHDADTVPWEWVSAGDITATAVGKGTAFMGLFSKSDLSASPVEGDATYAWALNLSKVSGGGNLGLEALSWSSGAGAFSRLRQLEITPPSFSIEAATAVGEDLDGDGYPELILEAWGEGQWAAWVIPDFTNKSATAPVRALLHPLSGQANLANDAADASEGAVRVASSSFLLNGARELRAQVGSIDPLRPALVQSFVTWSVADVIVDDAKEVSSTGGGFLGTQYLNKTPPSTAGRGFCFYGKCFSPPGYAGRPGSSMLLGGGGDGSSVLTASAGEHLGVAQDPSADALIVYRGAEGDVWPRLIVEGAGGPVEAELAWGADGPAVSLDGVPVMAIGPADALSVISTGDGDFAFFSTALSVDPATTTTISVNVRVNYNNLSGEGALPPDTTNNGVSTAPVVLSEEVSDDGGLLLGWRDGDGQAWLGVLDLAGAAALSGDTLPFLQGPVAIGAPLRDPDGLLGLSGDRPGMVRARNRIIADTPFLSMEDLEKRFSHWDGLSEAPFNSSAYFHGPAAMVVGTDSGGAEVLVLSGFDTLDALVTTSLVRADTVVDRLPIPELSASLLPDAPPILVSRSTAGDISFVLVDADGPRAQTKVPSIGALPEGGRLTAGDLNGDGLTDLAHGYGRDSIFLLSDGGGGVLMSGESDLRLFTNFAVLLSGSAHDEECALDTDGGGAWTLGSAFFGSSG